MKATWHWALALAAAVAGYVGWGWQGLVLALTVVMFWMLLEFNRTLRVMRNAASRPKGAIDSAVMFNSKLQRGMLLSQVMQISGSFGVAPTNEPLASVTKAGSAESYSWTDNSGASVHVQLSDGKVTAWTLQRGA